MTAALRFSIAQFALILVFLSGFVSWGCSKSDDQVEFEREARSLPENITERNGNGEIVDNAEDSDDWRIGPMFQGLVEVETSAYPNPVNVNARVRIDLYLTGVDAVRGLEVVVFQEPDFLIGPVYVENGSSLSPGDLTINLNPTEFAPDNNPERAVGLNRILIYDGNENLITYGDVEVE